MMAEQSNLDGDRLALVDQLAKNMYDDLAVAVIADIRGLPDDCRQSGDDSKLKDVWEEFKDQLQNEESIYFDAYEQTIRSLCSARTSELDADRQRLLWLWSEGYLERWVDEDVVRLADLDVDQINEELYRRVCDVASNEPLRHELEDEINDLCPSDWPGQHFVELDNIDDAPNWLLATLGDQPSLILCNLPAQEESLARRLAEGYLSAIDEQKLDIPRAVGDDPGDRARIAECRAGTQKEFVEFLRHWRERAQEVLEKLNLIGT